MNRDPFAAIADPTRRNIIELLTHESLTLNQLSDNFGSITRQAVSKQVKYLQESGLLKVKKVGRERYCYLHLQELNKVNNWLKKYEVFWNKKLDNLELYLKKKSN
jgi:DNA-binding transcriptional ArsR family regulator